MPALRSTVLAGALGVALTTGPLAAPAWGQQAGDPLFTERDAVLAGAFAVGTAVVTPLDERLAVWIQGEGRQANRFFQRAADTFNWMAQPGILIAAGALYTVGRVGGNERMADIALHSTEAVALGLGITGAGKLLAGRARPQVDVRNPRDFRLGRGLREEDYRSFPSGHSTVAFAAAAAAATEMRRWWPDAWYVAPLLYGSASMSGLSRMYLNKHWATDVVVGAAIGTFAGRKVVRYSHAHPDNRVDRLLLVIAVQPVAAGRPALTWALIPR